MEVRQVVGENSRAEPVRIGCIAFCPWVNCTSVKAVHLVSSMSFWCLLSPITYRNLATTQNSSLAYCLTSMFASLKRGQGALRLRVPGAPSLRRPLLSSTAAAAVLPSKAIRRVARSAVRSLRPSASSRTMTREALILGLESLEATSPAFPPLEAVVGGLMKLLNTYETMVQNEDDRRRLYERIDAMQENLVIAWGDRDFSTCPISDAQVRALERLDISIQDILREASATTGVGRRDAVKRFILARKHKADISDLLRSLSDADDDFRRSVELDTSRRLTDVQSSITLSSESSSQQHAVLRTEIRNLHILLTRVLCTPLILGLFSRTI
ncbi:unnamed protein product [Peniophora sp. CBMAI 1063]|nr:unnamed protein product [Peniophora sp. CBMAI 1063]